MSSVTTINQAKIPGRSNVNSGMATYTKDFLLSDRVHLANGFIGKNAGKYGTSMLPPESSMP